MPRTQSITTKQGPAKKWAPIAAAALLAELGFLALNAGIPLPGGERVLAIAAPWLERMPAAAAARPSNFAVGQVISSRGPLKFRARGSPIWDELPPSGLLDNGQSLRTLEHGSATVALFDGSVLTLDENSRIELNARGDEIGLKLVAGGVHRRLAASTAPLHAGYRPSIQIFAAEAGIAVPHAAEFSLKRAEDSARRLDLRVLDGEVGLRAATGSFLLKPGEEALELASQDGGGPGNFEFRKMPFVLLLPHAAQTVGGARTRFEWNVDTALTGGSPLELQISLDSTFEHVVKAARIAATEPPLRHVVTDVELPTLLTGDKPWYWRVRAVTDTAVVSDSSSFWSPLSQTPVSGATGAAQADAPPRPRLRLPLESAVAVTDEPLELVWAAVPGASGYEVDIDGRDQPIVAHALDVAVSAAEIPVGRRTWRVRARLANASVSPWSDPRALTVMASDPLRKPANQPADK